MQRSAATSSARSTPCLTNSGFEPNRSLGSRRLSEGRIPRACILRPEAPGLLAASLGLSRMYLDDLEQLAAGMTLYDAFYRWARDASDETHNWPTTKPGKSP